MGTSSLKAWALSTLLGLLALAAALLIPSAPGPGLASPDRFFEEGVEAAGREDLVRSGQLFAQALAGARRMGDRRLEGRALHALGNIALRRSDIPGAQAFYQAALPVALEVQDPRLLRILYRGLGDVAFELGRNGESLRYYEEALARARRDSDRDLAEGLLNSIGSVYLEWADYGKALQYFEEAVRTGTDDASERSYVLNNLGIVYGSQGNADLGLEYFERSLRLAEEQGDDYARRHVLNNIGVYHQGEKRYGLALRYYTRALRLAEAGGDQGAMTGHWHSIASVYEEQGRHELAAQAYGKSLALAEAAGARNLVSQALAGLAEVEFSRQRYEKAAELAGRAAATAAGTGSRETFWTALTLAGRALHALGRDGEAARAYADAIDTIEVVRSRMPGGELGRQAVLEGRIEPYVRRVELAADLGEAAEALARAEAAKARILLETVRDGRVDLAALLTPEERRADQRLRDRLGALNGEAFLAGFQRSADRAALRQIERRRDQVRRELEAFNASLYAARPDLRARRADFPEWDLEHVHGLLAGGTVLVEYTVLEDRTYLFTVREDSGSAPTVRLHRLPIGREALAREVEAFRARLAARDLDFRGPARRLYGLLLAPAAAELQGGRTLCIVPDGPLWDLPFQVLQLDGSEVLLDRHAVYYAPSLSFLAELASRKARDPRPATLLAVGDPRLPEAEKEVQALSQLYGPGHSAVYTSAFPEARLKAEAGRYRVLHFATHALLDDRNPMYSSLVLSGSQGPARGGEGGEDGLLEAWEILDLRLDADLVVLAACQTARGRPRGGEGMIGMSWALAAAGSPATVASQWEVDSASTRQLMVELHRGWLAGLGKAEALRQAALAVRAREPYRHPFYWAGFVLVGEGD